MKPIMLRLLAAFFLGSPCLAEMPPSLPTPHGDEPGKAEDGGGRGAGTPSLVESAAGIDALKNLCLLDQAIVEAARGAKLMDKGKGERGFGNLTEADLVAQMDASLELLQRRLSKIREVIRARGTSAEIRNAARRIYGLRTDVTPSGEQIHSAIQRKVTQASNNRKAMTCQRDPAVPEPTSTPTPSGPPRPTLTPTSIRPGEGE